MSEMHNHLAKLINRFSPADGFNETPVPGVHCIKRSNESKREKRHWRASLAIVVQGCKEVVLGNQVYRAVPGHYSVTPFSLPVTSRFAVATPEKPLLGLMIDFNPVIVSEVAAQLEKDSSKEKSGLHGAFFMGQASDKMLEAALRLAKLFQSPEDAPVLGPLIVKEIIYHLLKGPDGAAIRQFVRSESKMHKVSRAIHVLKSDLSEEVDVLDLAKAANMNRSDFFKSFKEATSMSPIQYQKRLRLLEAQRLLREEGESAEGAAFKVGYNSASQFSREYSRMFGKSPGRDGPRIKKREKSI